MRAIPSFTMRDYVDKTAGHVKQCLNLARNYNVSLAMENHGYISSNREFISEVINKVSSERFGLALDTVISIGMDIRLANFTTSIGNLHPM